MLHIRQCIRCSRVRGYRGRGTRRRLQLLQKLQRRRRQGMRVVLQVQTLFPSVIIAAVSHKFVVTQCLQIREYFILSLPERVVKFLLL